MHAALRPHPDSPASPVMSVEVSVSPVGDALLLAFEARGAIARLALPTPAGGRADELWRHTCLEAFVGDAEGDGYLELNFAPSSQWAAYRFDGYRAGMAKANLPAPAIRVAIGADRLKVAARVVVSAAGRRLALSAVFEDIDGAKSYWALTHPPGAPDFHHPSAFALSLPTEPA